MKATPKFCVHCGAPINLGEKFCASCGAQLVKNLFDKTPIEPTPIEPTEIKPTEIEPTNIEPTNIEPTEITPTEITPTEIKPTEIEPTPIEPTPIVQGVWGRLVFFFTHPNQLIFGILSFVSTLTTVILIAVNGFKWWIIFFLLVALVSLFEVVYSFIKTPALDGSKNLVQKLKNWLGIKDGAKITNPKPIVGGGSGMAAAATMVVFLLVSLFSGFKNFVVLDGYTFRCSFSSSGYNPETDYEIVTFYPGHKARDTVYRNGEVLIQLYGTYWRIGNDCGIKCKTLEKGSWNTWGYSEKWGSTLNFEIKSYKDLLSGGTHFYRTI